MNAVHIHYTFSKGHAKYELHWFEDGVHQGTTTVYFISDVVSQINGYQRISTNEHNVVEALKTFNLYNVTQI